MTPTQSATTGVNTHASHGAAAHEKDEDQTSSSMPSGAAAAMLALLGQSIPANATPTPSASSTANANNTALAATSLQAAMPASTLPGVLQATGQSQSDADDLVDTAKSLDALADKALADSGADEDDTATPVASGDSAGATKVLAALTASASSSKGSSDHSDPLEALRAMTAAPLQQAPAQTLVTPAAHSLTMQASAGTPAFAQELGQQVAWLGGQDVKQARIRLHPEDLGELDVKVSVQHGSVDVSFVAQHPQAVHAVQQTLGQLDSMLAHHGLTLGQAQVGQGGRGGEQGQGTNASGAAGADTGNGEGSELAAIAAPVVKAVGLLDMFA
ncbi:flagellar hook-length control protein FliK [Dyella solisilvae]|uniref:Flagellar hook-length control protein FliK n=1 Tax=Dyella solisilvae TaxID=1920168 RepID=A0A370K503_9GAMM|nr:flagellar hook-length control protein FliK [Dyella solisilvae]